MNAIERAIKAVSVCPDCRVCPYEDYSVNYCGNCKERRREDARTAWRLLEAIRKTEKGSEN